ncbi:hypothetical protein NQ318_022395 [Aromia moschata]|uniref:Uncharacterized protein n=1 Tax=Aromia moschata TaxID=1265417 RepID=A0AAV8Z522_9CUCU|nr:hypothetical protein NQ318_022395 [Aromia moschata]
MVHSKCRGGTYPFSDVKRVIFPDDKVTWGSKSDNYNPPDYDSKVLLNKLWADPPLGKRSKF